MPRTRKTAGAKRREAVSLLLLERAYKEHRERLKQEAAEMKSLPLSLTRRQLEDIARERAAVKGRDIADAVGRGKLVVQINGRVVADYEADPSQHGVCRSAESFRSKARRARKRLGLSRPAGRPKKADS